MRSSPTHRLRANRTSSGRRRAVTGVGDQLLYSLGNFALTILVAHWSTPTEFGAYSLAIATYLILLAVTRGLICETYVVKFSASSPELSFEEARAGLGAMVILGLLAGALLLGVAFVLPHSVRTMFFLFAALFPVLVLQDHLRYAALGLGRPSVAFVSDVVVSVVQYGSAAVLIVAHEAHATYFVIEWGVATGIGGVVAFWLLGMQLPRSGLLDWVRRHRELAVRYAADDIANQGSQQANSYVVAGLTGLSDAGGLRAAQTVFGPSAIVNFGVQAAVTPELIRVLRVSSTRMKLYAQGIGVGLGLVGAAWGVAALAAPMRVGETLFGPSWPLAKPLIIFLAIAQVGNGIRVAPTVGLRALGAANRTLRARTIALILGLAVTLAGAVVDGARGVAIAYAIVSPAQVLVWWWQFEIALRDHRRERAREHINQAWTKLTQRSDVRESARDASPLG